MGRRAILSTTLLAAALAAGCFEGKADITLNPDGTGKIVGEITFQPSGPWAVRSTSNPDLQLDDPETQMKESVRKILKSSRGVEAWKDVSFKRLPDDRIRFTGTAYFKDLSKVSIHPDDAKSRAAFGPEGDKVLMLVLHRPKDQDDSRTSWSRYTSESLARHMKAMRQSFREARGPIGLQLVSMQLDLRFHVPGLPDEAKGLEQVGRTLTFSTTGPQLLRHMDSLVADNAYLRQMTMTGQSLSGRTLGKALSSRIFSQKGEVWARMTGYFRPGFNYEAEVKDAETQEKEMLIRLGLEQERTSRPSSKQPSRSKTDDPKSDSPKHDDPKKADPKPPGLPLPKGLPSIPAPILPF